MYDLSVNVDFDEESAAKFCQEAEEIAKHGDKSQAIWIYIDSNGGAVDSLYKMLAFVKFLKKKGFKINTYCTDKAYSCGAVLFSVGEKRVMKPTATVMIHEVSFGVRERLSEVIKTVEEVKQLNDDLFNIMSRNFKINKRKLLKIVGSQDRYFHVEECLKLGIATDTDCF